MQFFRKYNKHLLAVFMALLLVIWLGGSAIEEFARVKPGKRVVGTADGGPITEADTSRAKMESDLLGWMGLSWQQMGARVGLPEPTNADERLGQIDWVLLKREAKRLGSEMTPERAEELLSGPAPRPGERSLREQIRIQAAQRNIRAQLIYDAAANYFSVWNAMTVFLSVTAPPEPELRRWARDISEFASIEAVVLPATSFADPEQTFSEAELTRQFESYKSVMADGGLNFGYFLKPRVKVQYIRIDPDKIKEHLRGSEQSYLKDAYTYWQENRETAGEFRWTIAEIDEFKKNADATSNGVKTPELGAFYTDFAQAQEKALTAVKLNAAKAETDRITNRLIQAVREPWFNISYDESGHKPAPDTVKSDGYYQDMIAALPANLQYPEGITVQTADWTTEEQLVDDIEGFSQAGLPMPNGGFVRPVQLAFNVQGIVDAPEERRRDTSLHLSLWQTFAKQVTGLNGSTYLFRVVGAQAGREPESLTEIADLVADELRLQAGRAKAKSSAEAFLADIGTLGLSEAWVANEELKAKVTPYRGGYVEPPLFARDNSLFTARGDVVQPFGRITDEFIDVAFKLATDGEASQPAVIELPDEARVVLIKGKSLRPLYREDFQARRDFLRQQFGRQQQAEIVGQWLNAKKVRERNHFEFKKDT